MELLLENVACRRSGRLIFAGLSARVPAGGALMLRGPNGAGKSTLLRAIAGLLPATGRIRLGDRDIAAEPGAAAEMVAYAGHLDPVKPQLTVGENIAFWARLLGAPRAAEALDTLALTPLAKRPARFCSAGQRRRLGLARLFLAERPLWLLDEPLTSLDRESAHAFTKALEAHRAAGGLVVAATHADLGLTGAEELHLAPAPPQQDLAEDPFLAGDWG
ncbi:MAG: heme ABC exporter ATP-binding protein CcmA [Pseudomonadota bacterium]